MNSPTLTSLALALLACAPALAQDAGQGVADLPILLKPTKMPTAARNAGIYHLTTGTWTRRVGASAAFGPDVIYSNTAASGYFSTAGGNGGFAPNSTNYDEGGIPGTANTDHPGADRDEYFVNGFEVGYCDMAPASSDSQWEIEFYTADGDCSTPAALPDARIQTGPLPTNGCWVVSIDLSGGAEFTLGADGGDGFQDIVEEDRFAWSFRYTGTGTAPAGFFLRGHPAVTEPSWVPGVSDFPRDGTNTYYGVLSACGPDAASGYLTADRWHAWHPSGVWTSCYFFGGYSTMNGCGGNANPMASWHMEILADVGPGDELAGTPYCESLPNSDQFVSSIFLTGSPDPSDDDVLLRAQLPPHTVGMFLTSETPGNQPLPGGSQGVLCVGGNVGRFVAPGQVKFSDASGWITLDTNAGEWSVAALPSATGAYAARPGRTSHFQLWHRDLVGGATTSNFTDAKSFTWQ